jgi:hypothetical protein
MVRSERRDLARVQATGKIEPLDAGATRELASREGTYRILPAPRGVILMRGMEPTLTGAIRLAGEITAPGTVCDVFMMLSQMGWRGQLVLTDGEATRTVFLEKGNVLGAQTSVDDERLGAVMYRYGVLSKDDLARVAARTQRGSRFGAVALELQLISEREVYRCLRHQVEEITFATFALASGTFCFLDGFDAAKLVSHQVIAAQALLMDGITRMDEIRYFREKVPSAEYVPERVPGLPAPPPSGEYGPIYALIDGTRSVAELGRLSGRGEFAVTKDVYGLERLGIVNVKPPARIGGPLGVLQLGNRVLRTIHAEADAAGKGRELRKGLASYIGGGSGTYGVLSLMTVAEADGSLDIARFDKNVQRLGEAAERTLRHMLYEYISFAIFCVGAAAGRQREAELSQALEAELKELEPRAGDSVRENRA